MPRFDIQLTLPDGRTNWRRDLAAGDADLAADVAIRDCAIGLSLEGGDFTPGGAFDTPPEVLAAEITAVVHPHGRPEASTAR